MSKTHNKISDSREDKIFNIIIHIIIAALLVIIAYPLIFVLSSSFSSKDAVTNGKVFLFPVDFSLEGYEAVFKKNDVIIGYRNTFIYTIIGTMINLFLTMIAAYPLSRKDLPFGKGLILLFTFTMIFSGGMIPTYMLVKSVGLINKPAVMVLVGSISAYNLIIARTFIQNNIPIELLEASRIDGCSDFLYFAKIVLPLSKSVIAVLTLYYAITHWNSYFNAFIYLNNRKYWPLQLYLREILLENQIDASQIVDPELQEAKQGMANLLKYSLIVVSTIPVMLLYPFIQKHFVTGVMIGSVKG
ncbi:MAG: carbohydrate ABC transporter permease [Oscillospiraceae bacterium]|nr:carbohydrate ABC transporter permease [Oscillospiraceae bacterium]